MYKKSINVVLDFIKIENLLPGMTFKTTLLGRVPYTSDDAGDYVGYIPKVLQYWALKNGLQIEAALFKENAYIVRVLTIK